MLVNNRSSLRETRQPSLNPPLWMNEVDESRGKFGAGEAFGNIMSSSILYITALYSTSQLYTLHHSSILYITV
ncbi:hypothetical protein RRG08_001354 [Elysia crispata]|uniref:Uncharacterized protein n=1 Tax=Elysia crispata TaxID=231223 RepID=A0AAE1B807_9GAST|nr:hypothetical protein RRG08_001354 [Elysia crispata]